MDRDARLCLVRNAEILGVLFVLSAMVGCASSPRYRTVQPIPQTRQGFIDRISSGSSARAGSYDSSSADSAYESSSFSSSSSSSTRGPAARVATSSSAGSRHGSGVPARVWQTGTFLWPVKDVSVTSRFGKRGRRFHDGIDLRAPVGTPIYASHDGVVLYAGHSIRGYGKMVIIRHHRQINTIYAHNSVLHVRRGQQVKQGQLIAHSGRTGRVTGPHLHFEIRKGASPVNPLAYLPPAEKNLAFLKNFGMR